MHPLLIGLFLFIVFLITHLSIWRVRLPKRHLKTLAVLMVLVFVGWLSCSVHGFEWFEYLRVGILYFSISFCYLVTYSAIEADSPTLSLMSFIDESGPVGRSYEEIAGFFSKRPFVKIRLDALVQSGVIRQRNDTYTIVKGSSMVFRLILAYRKLYGPLSKNG